MFNRYFPAIVLIIHILSAASLFAANEEWYKFDDYKQIPELNHRIVKTLYRTNRGNEDLDAYLWLEVDYPKGKTEFDGIIRDLISKKIYEYLGSFSDTKSSFFYMPGANVYSMLDYYGVSYINHLNKSIPLYVTDSLAFRTAVVFHRVAESDDIVTYRELTHHDNPLYSAMAHASSTESFYTISKETYNRINFDSIVTPSGAHHVKELLIKRLALAFSERRGEKLTVDDVLQSASELQNVYSRVQALVDSTEYTLPSISIEDFPVCDTALLPNGLLFYYPKYEISYGYEGEYSIILDYKEIADDLRPDIRRVISSFYNSLSDTYEEDDSISLAAIEYIEKGDYATAEDYLTSTLSIETDSPHSVRRMQILALIQSCRGENSFAIKTYERLLEQFSPIMSVNSYWTETFNCATLLWLEENLTRGKELLESLKKETVARPMVIEYYMSLLLALSIEFTSEINEKIRYAEIEHKIDVDLYGENVLSRVNYLSRIARIYFNGEKWDEALTVFDELLDITQKEISTLYPYGLYGLSQLQVQSHSVWDIQRKRAFILSQKGDIPSAISAIEDGYCQLLGKKELEDVYFWDQLAQLYLQANQNSKAVEIANKCFLQLMDYTRRAATSMTLDERNELYSFCSYWLLESLPLIIKATHTEEYDNILYNAALIGKGLKLSADRNLYSLIMSSGDKGIIAKYETLRNLMQQIDDAIYENKSAWEIESLKKQYYLLEKELSEQSAIFGNYLSVFDITFTDITNRLNSKEAAIEFINYKVGDHEQYYALVLSPAHKVPKSVYLFSVPSNRGNIHISIYNAYDKIWAPIIKECGGAKTIYFAPSGLLSISPIESALDLPKDYNLVRLSTTRNLLTTPSSISSAKKEAALFGGINYEHSINNNPSSRDIYIDKESANMKGDDYIGRGTREYLAGTLDEVRQIGASLNRGQYKVSYYTGDDGSESNFKQLSGLHTDILHIATHGFYLTHRDLSRDDYSSIIRQFDYSINTDDNDLSRSGLLMSGANWILDGHAVDNPYDDGILSSAEISRLDFSRTELVVLSACQSGLGEVMKDGVAGLQRGFKKAGAKTLLLSLWEVDDRATMILMKEFYSRVLAGASYRDSLKAAQDYVMKYKKGMYSHYKYWAAWIIID